MDNGARVWLAQRLPPRRSVPRQRRAVSDIAPQGSVVGEQVDTLAVLNDEATRFVDGQRQASSLVDTKAGGLLTLSMAGIALVASARHGWLHWVAIACFGVLALLATAALAIRSWNYAPGPDHLDTMEDCPREAVLDQLVRGKAHAAIKNRESMEAKADWVKIAAWWSVVCVIVAVLALR